MIFEPLHVQHSIHVHIDQLTVRPRQSLPDSHGFLPSLCCGNFMPFRTGRLKYRAGENDYRHREEGRWRQEIGIGGDDQRLMLSVASVTVFMLTSYLLLLILY